MNLYGTDADCNGTERKYVLPVDTGGARIYSLSHQGAPPTTETETETMIPKEGNDLIELHMQNARETEQDEFAEKMLGNVEAILGYALACSHIDCVEYGNRLTLLKLIRAQRKNRAAAQS